MRSDHSGRASGRLAWHWRPLPLLAGLEGVALVLPTSLGATLLVFLQVGPSQLASGFLATTLGLVLVHLFTLSSPRPVLFSARMFEATTLAAMLSQLGALLPGWGLADTPEVRLVFLCAIGAGAGLVTGLLYLLRADRLTRYIPAPVFSGFSNSIAALLVVSQLGTLAQLVREGQQAWLLVVLATTAGGVMLAVRLRWGKLPAAAVGLAAGALLAQGLQLIGHTSLSLANGQLPNSLPFMAADLAAFTAPSVSLLPVVGHVLTQAAILGLMAFINTSVTLENFTHLDGQRLVGSTPRLLQAAGVAIASALGAPVLTASQQGSSAVLRTARLTPLTVFWSALFFALAYASGMALWMPVAVVCGVMIADAWFFVDRVSVRHLWRWMGRQPLSANAREDLALVSAVTLTAVLVNMVAAVVVGIMLGLLLFAMRNARKPVRHIWSGHQMRSNCARPRLALAALDASGHRIKVFELEGDLFFGSASALYETLEREVAAGQWAVIDWSRSRHVDTSVVRVVARLHAHLSAHGVTLLHAGVRPASALGEAMAEGLPSAATFTDVDRALEAAENALLATLPLGLDTDAHQSEPTHGFLRGLAPEQRERVWSVMRIQSFAAGETVVRAGEPSHTLMLVMTGSASVVVQSAHGTDVRLSTVLPGATLGEIGFLDQAPRSANVVATEDLVLACLDREQFDHIGATEPQIVQQLLANIAVDIAARLRSVSSMVAARNRA